MNLKHLLEKIDTLKLGNFFFPKLPISHVHKYFNTVKGMLKCRH